MKKDLGIFSVFCVALGAIVGWGCFVLPGTDFLPSAGPAGSAIALFAGSFIMIIISSSYGYLIDRYPGSGGEFTYVLEIFGKKQAFICAWALIFAYGLLIPINGTAIGLLSRFFFPGLIQRGYLYTIAGWDVYLGEVIIAMLSIILLATLNILGVKFAAWIQTAISLILVAAVFITTIIIISSGVDFSNLSPAFPLENNSYSYGGILSVLAIAPWAYLGFDCVPQMSDEYKFPHRITKHILFASLTVSALLYVLVVLITAVACPWQELLSRNYYWPTGVAIYTCSGAFGTICIGIAMLCGIISTMNAFFLSCSRLVQSVAEQSALPEAFARIHPKYKTPARAIIVITAVSLIAPWFGRQVLSWIVDMTALGTSVVFLYTTLAAASAAAESKNRKQRTISLLGAAFSLFFIATLLLPISPSHLHTPSLIALAVWVILGALYWVKKKSSYLAADLKPTDFADTNL